MLFFYAGAANSNDELDNILAKPAKPVKRTFSIPTSAKRPVESSNTNCNIGGNLCFIYQMPIL